MLQEVIFFSFFFPAAKSEEQMWTSVGHQGDNSCPSLLFPGHLPVLGIVAVGSGLALIIFGISSFLIYRWVCPWALFFGGCGGVVVAAVQIAQMALLLFKEKLVWKWIYGSGPLTGAGEGIYATVAPAGGGAKAAGKPTRPAKRARTLLPIRLRHNSHLSRGRERVCCAGVGERGRKWYFDLLLVEKNQPTGFLRFWQTELHLFPSLWIFAVWGYCCM